MAKLKYFFVFLLAALLLSCGKNNTADEETSGKKSIVPEVEESVEQFVFVGSIQGRPGLYKYTVENKTIKPFWSGRNEKVVELSYSDDMQSAFFLTARGYGKKGAFPFINKVKLYHINPDSMKAKEVENLGSGLQLFSRWENNDNFKVVINSIDKTVASYVDQRTKVYDKSGKLLVDENKIFDIGKQGYPEPIHPKLNTLSPTGRFQLISNGDKNPSIYLRDLDNNKDVFIVKSSFGLRQIEWTIDDSLLVFSIADITPNNNTLYNKMPQTSKLILYDVVNHKIIKEWEGGGVKNFYLTKKLLIFDDGFSNNSSIKIYDYKKQKLLDTIEINGGCGLRNIPQLPDYSA